MLWQKDKARKGKEVENGMRKNVKVKKVGRKGRKGKGEKVNGKTNGKWKRKPHMAEGFSINRWSCKNLAFSDPLIPT